MQKPLQLISLILLLGIVAYSFQFVGSPEYQRQLRQDGEKITDLKNINCVIENYFYQNGNMPPDMEAIKRFHTERTGMNSHVQRYGDSCYCYMQTDIDFADLQGVAYEYKALDKPSTYQLCATFNLSGKELEMNQYLYEKWAKDFQPGRYCFETTLSTCKKDK